jgi:uncharacterized membrane protein
MLFLQSLVATTGILAQVSLSWLAVQACTMLLLLLLGLCGVELVSHTALVSQNALYVATFYTI